MHWCRCFLQSIRRADRYKPMLMDDNCDFFSFCLSLSLSLTVSLHYSFTFIALTRKFCEKHICFFILSGPVQWIVSLIRPHTIIYLFSFMLYWYYCDAFYFIRILLKKFDAHFSSLLQFFMFTICSYIHPTIYLSYTLHPFSFILWCRATKFSTLEKVERPSKENGSIRRTPTKTTYAFSASSSSSWIDRKK